MVPPWTLWSSNPSHSLAWLYHHYIVRPLHWISFQTNFSKAPMIFLCFPHGICLTFIALSPPLGPWGFLSELSLPALASVAQWVGCHPANWKVMGSIPGQGTCLCCGFGPWSRFSPQLGHMQGATDWCFSLTLMFLSLIFSLPSPLSRINKRKEILFQKTVTARCYSPFPLFFRPAFSSGWHLQNLTLSSELSGQNGFKCWYKQ